MFSYKCVFKSMNKHLILTLHMFLICLNYSSCSSPNQINDKLKKELDAILHEDQFYRAYLDPLASERKKDEIAKSLKFSRSYLDSNIFSIINKIDKKNLIKVERILKIYGYPGKSLVGEPTNTAVFLVIQHSSKISKYYQIIEKAGIEGELPFIKVATMLDRKLIEEGKSQLYGTQLEGRFIIKKNKGKEYFMYVLPISDAKNVNKRRKEAGFETTVEQNAERFGIRIKNTYTPKLVKSHN